MVDSLLEVVLVQLVLVSGVEGVGVGVGVGVVGVVAGVGMCSVI